MRTPRSTQVAERLILVLCWSIACFFAGKWMGEEQAADKTKPCYEAQKQNIHMSKRTERNWINYWKART